MVNKLIHPKGVLLVESQDSVHPSQVLPYQTPSSMSLWTILLILVHNHVKTGRSHPQTLWCNEALSLSFTGTKGPSQNPKKQHHTIIPPPPNFTVCPIVRPAVQITPENTSSLQHTTITSYTLHCAWWWKPIPQHSVHCPWSEGHMNVEVYRYWLCRTRPLCIQVYIVSWGVYCAIE